MIALRRHACAALVLAPLTVALLARPAGAGSIPELEGFWAVARATMNGERRTEAKVLNATWTFRGDELVVQTAGGERLRASLSLDATANPPALRVTPIAPSRERPLWMIWAYRGSELDVAYYDGVDQRPEDFGPRPKLVVLTLVPVATATPPAALDPCKILRGAGVERLLGGPTLARQQQRSASAPGTSCALDRTDGSAAISLTLVGPPAGPEYVAAARKEALANQRLRIEAEPSLGSDAFSASGGWTIVMVADRRGTAMILKLEALKVEPGDLRRFAARVLDALERR
jgi:uncharacterized protein (TIGR03067 family)